MSKSHGEKGLYQAKSTFFINGLPDWIWVKAHPVSEKDLPEIKAFYQELINAFSRKDLDKIWTITKLAWEEWAIADNSSPKIFFDSMGFKEKFDSGNYVTRITPDWKNFRLVRYKGGRIFRLEEGSFGNSPIQLDNKITGKTAVYNPYLSIVNGKIIISR